MRETGPSHPREPMIFALDAGRSLATRVCEHLAVPLGHHEERDFEDGEHKTRVLEPVRGRHVYLLQSLHAGDGQSANDKLVRSLFFAASMRDAGARQVTCIAPYLCYSRKDRRTKPWDPVNSRYVACLFEAMRVDRVVTVDVHNVAAFQNAFRIPSEHLTAAPALVQALLPDVQGDDVVVVSPDAGGSKRAEAFRRTLEAALNRPVGLGFVEKFRSAGVVRGGTLVGDVKGRSVILVDDLVSSGETLARAAHACRTQGARAVYAAATHGVFSSRASGVLREGALESLVIMNTIPPDTRLDADVLQARVRVVDCAPLLADAVRRLHSQASLVELTDVS